MKNNKQNLDFLVTGTGRCGTVYMAELLTSLGIPCGHESFFQMPENSKQVNQVKNKFEKIIMKKAKPELSKISLQGDLAKKYPNFWHSPRTPWVSTSEVIADSSYFSAPFLNHDLLKNTKIIHVVRHPLDVISSFVEDFNYFQKTSAPTNDDEIDAPQQFIYKNLPILSKKLNQINRCATYYIEWNKMIESNKIDLLIQVEKAPLELMNYLNIKTKSYYKDKTRNSRKIKRPTIKLKDIHPNIRKKLIQIGIRYGYFKKFSEK
jgi:hypothetical protein